MGETDVCLNRLVTYEELSHYPQFRQRKWWDMVHVSQQEREWRRFAVRSRPGWRSAARGWVQRLSSRLELDLTVRQRGRPRKIDKLF